MMRHRLWRGCADRRCKMVADALQRAISAAVIGAENGGAGHQPDIVHPGQFADGAGGPLCARHAGDFDALGIQPAAGEEILVGKDDPGAGAPGDKSRLQAGWPGADHQHVAMGRAFS